MAKAAAGWPQSMGYASELNWCAGIEGAVRISATIAAVMVWEGKSFNPRRSCMAASRPMIGPTPLGKRPLQRRCLCPRSAEDGSLDYLRRNIRSRHWPDRLQATYLIDLPVRMCQKTKYHCYANPPEFDFAQRRSQCHRLRSSDYSQQTKWVSSCNTENSN